MTTKQGTPVVVAVHGGGIYATPQRFERLYHANQARSNSEGFTGQYAGKISTTEARDILEGKLPDSSEIPMYRFDEFKQGVANLPIRYGVILDYDMARKSTKGYQSFDVLRDEPNMIVRAGGVEPLHRYLDKAQPRHNTEVMGNFHPFDQINPEQPQTRVTFLAGNRGGMDSEGGYQYIGYDAGYGIGGYACMLNMARYVAVAPKKASASIRDLSFTASS